MANIKSAEKRARQALKKRDRNASRKKAVKTAEKKLRAAISAKNWESAQGLLSEFMSIAKRAANRGVLHANGAARKTSRLSHLLVKSQSSAKSPTT